MEGFVASLPAVSETKRVGRPPILGDRPLTSTERSRRRRARMKRAPEPPPAQIGEVLQFGTAAPEPPPAPTEPAPDLLTWCAALVVSQGEHAGATIEVLPWQREYLERVEASAGGELGLSIAAGGGKTTLIAAIAAAAVAGPLAQRRASVIVVAASFQQACLAFDAAASFLQPTFAADPERWRVLRSEQHALIQDRETGAELRAREATPGTLHGSAPVLIVCDEPAQWAPTKAARTYSALRSRLGKIPGARLLAIGTRPDDPGHWFSGLLRRAGVTYAALPDADYRDRDEWHRANPSLAHFPALMAVYEREAREAEADPSLLPAFRALRLNLGTADTATERLVALADWILVAPSGEIADPPARSGPVCIGFDAGGSSSMSCAVLAYPETGRVEALAAFPADPDLAERGRIDGVDRLYVDMEARGELRTYGGRVTPVGRFLVDVADYLGAAEVVGFAADRYRQSELIDALQDAGLHWPCEWRGQGAGEHGQFDTRAFQSWVKRADLLVVHGALLMTAAVTQSRVRYDTNGGPSVDRSRARSRIDALQAGLLAVGLAERYRAAQRRAAAAGSIGHYSF